MSVRQSEHSYACPLSNEIHPPSPVIHDGFHTALEQRFEEEIVREEEQRFVFPRREEEAGQGS